MTKKRLALLLRLERMMGQCYNGNIRNFGPGGIEEAEGRDFQYPLRIECKDASVFKEQSGVRSILWIWLSEGQNEDDSKFDEQSVMTGCYKFGANEMPVLKNLDRVLQFLEENYSLKVDKPVKKSR